MNSAQKDKLILIDIICHGITPASYYNGYMKFLSDKYRGKIIDVHFRSKHKGYGTFLLKIDYIKKSKFQTKYLRADQSYYYKYFLNGTSYRDYCYTCKFAQERRVGDITLGDFWGSQELHPLIDASHGISLVLANTEKGITLFDSIKDQLIYDVSSLERAKKYNKQLVKPSTIGPDRNNFTSCKDPQIIQRYFMKKYWITIVIAKIKLFLPKSFIAILRRRD